MKLIQTIAISTLLITLFVNPLVAKDTNDFERKVRKKVARKMNFPDNDLEGQVYAQFSVTSKGRLEIIEVYSSNLELEEFVEEELDRMNLKLDTILIDQVFNLNFNFKKEEG